jgi:hypothetical protein
MARKRLRVEPTEDFQEILPLCWWPEQVEYERIRQPVLFGTSVTERAEQTGVSRRTLQTDSKSRLAMRAPPVAGDCALATC